jgi:hydrogenase-4 membrane subunit HyfE
MRKDINILSSRSLSRSLSLSCLYTSIDSTQIQCIPWQTIFEAKDILVIFSSFQFVLKPKIIIIIIKKKATNQREKEKERRDFV